jgi:hypothetical protein
MKRSKRKFSRKQVRDVIAQLEVLETIHVSEHPFTYVSMFIKFADDTFVARGFARCNWRDKWDKSLGFKIAENRAKYKLACKIMAETAEPQNRNEFIRPFAPLPLAA